MTNGVKVAMAMERIGQQVRVVEHKALVLDDVRNADIILAFGTLLYLHNVWQAKFIAENKRPETKFALWYFDACNPAFTHSLQKVGNMKRVAPHLDHLFMTDHSYQWEQYARKFTWLMQGVDMLEYNHRTVPHDRRRYDVIFTGTHLACFGEREKMLKQISALCSLKWIGANASQRVIGHDFFMAYQAAKVAFVPPPAACTNDHYWSNRLYLAAGTGTPCLVGYTPGLEDHYEDGKEIICFRNDAEMKTKLAALLSDTELRQRIGDAGRARTLRDHTYDVRARQLLEHLK
jgi:hypothetical protein